MQRVNLEKSRAVRYLPKAGAETHLHLTLKLGLKVAEFEQKQPDHVDRRLTSVSVNDFFKIKTTCRFKNESSTKQTCSEP